jgi:hypothetical protein
MERHEKDNWQEGAHLLLGGAVVVPAKVDVWAYDGKWGGELAISGAVRLELSDEAELQLSLEERHPIRIRSVSQRSADSTTVHFSGVGEPPFSPHAVPRPVEKRDAEQDLTAS